MLRKRIYRLGVLLNKRRRGYFVGWMGMVCVFVLISNDGVCQRDSSYQNTHSQYHLIYSGGISYQKQLVGEAGLMYGYSENGGPCNPPIGPLGIKFSYEFNFESHHCFVAPKISYQCDLALIGIRISLIDYTNHIYNDYKFTPELGITLFGYLDLFYGYNIPLTKDKIENIGTNRITMTINLNVFK